MLRDALKAVAVVMVGGFALVGAATTGLAGLLVGGYIPLNDAYEVICNVEQKGLTYAAVWGGSAAVNVVRSTTPHVARWMIARVSEAVADQITRV